MNVGSNLAMEIRRNLIQIRCCKFDLIFKCYLLNCWAMAGNINNIYGNLTKTKQNLNWVMRSATLRQFEKLLNQGNI